MGHVIVRSERQRNSRHVTVLYHIATTNHAESITLLKMSLTRPVHWTWRSQHVLRPVIWTAVIKRDLNVSERCCWSYVLWNITPCILVNACRTLQGIAVLRNVWDFTSRRGVKFVGAFVIFRKAAIRFVMSVRLSIRNNSPHTGRIFMKFDIQTIFEKKIMKIQDSLKSDKNNVGYLTWRPLDVLHHVSLNFF